MDRRDLELLDKQVRHIQPAPRYESTLLVALTVVLFAGIALESFVYRPQNQPPVQTAASSAPPSATPAR